MLIEVILQLFYSGDYQDEYLIDKDDLLITMDGEFKIKKWNSHKALLNQRVCKIQSSSLKLSNKYLYYFLPLQLKAIENRTSFVTVKHLSVKKIKEIKIPLPPLSTQKHIAEVLDAADALRQRDAALLSAYDDLLESVFLEMFGDVVNNEKGWDNYRFGDITISRLGKTHDKKKKQTGLEQRYYLGNANVLWHKFNFANLKQMDFNETERQTFSIEYGDLLICEGGEVGRCAIWENEITECYFQKAIHRVRVNKK